MGYKEGLPEHDILAHAKGLDFWVREEVRLYSDHAETPEGYVHEMRLQDELDILRRCVSIGLKDLSLDELLCEEVSELAERTNLKPPQIQRLRKSVLAEIHEILEQRPDLSEFRWRQSVAKAEPVANYKTLVGTALCHIETLRVLLHHYKAPAQLCDIDEIQVGDIGRKDPILELKKAVNSHELPEDKIDFTLTPQLYRLISETHNALKDSRHELRASLKKARYAMGGAWIKSVQHAVTSFTETTTAISELSAKWERA